MTEKCWKAMWSWAQWLLLPVLVFGLAEYLVRTTTDRIPLWYGAAKRIAERGQIDVMFVGSSRVLAAIPTEVFSETVALRTGQQLHTLNLGRGYTTLIEHYLGLRNLTREYPHSLQGVTVFIEAPGGLGFLSHWHDSWINEEQYQLLVDLLQPSDLPDFWRSGEDFRIKTSVTLRFFMRQIALLNRRERVRNLWLTELIPALIEGRKPTLTTVDVLGDDLQGPKHQTSIRTDEAALERARALAQQWGEKWAHAWEHTTEPIRDWRGTVIEDLLRLIQEVGGHLVFFVPPESEVFRRGYRSPLRQQNVVIFAEQVRNWGACLIQPAFIYTDEDLPDLWHLRPESAAKFTQILANEWLDRCDQRAFVRKIKTSYTPVSNQGRSNLSHTPQSLTVQGGDRKR